MRIACCGPDWMAMPAMRAMCVGDWFPGFGDCEQGVIRPCEVRTRISDSHKRYYGTSSIRAGFMKLPRPLASYRRTQARHGPEACRGARRNRDQRGDW